MLKQGFVDDPHAIEDINGLFGILSVLFGKYKLQQNSQLMLILFLMKYTRLQGSILFVL